MRWLSIVLVLATTAGCLHDQQEEGPLLVTDAGCKGPGAAACSGTASGIVVSAADVSNAGGPAVAVREVSSSLELRGMTVHAASYGIIVQDSGCSTCQIIIRDSHIFAGVAGIMMRGANDVTLILENTTIVVEPTEGGAAIAQPRFGIAAGGTLRHLRMVDTSITSSAPNTTGLFVIAESSEGVELDDVRVRATHGILVRQQPLRAEQLRIECLGVGIDYTGIKAELADFEVGSCQETGISLRSGAQESFVMRAGLIQGTGRAGFLQQTSGLMVVEDVRLASNDGGLHVFGAAGSHAELNQIEATSNCQGALHIEHPSLRVVSSRFEQNGLCGEAAILVVGGSVTAPADSSRLTTSIEASSFQGNHVAVAAVNASVDARGAWWGHPAGPTLGDQAPATGDPVRGPVVWLPHRTQP